jgi:hypothetical protein
VHPRREGKGLTQGSLRPRAAELRTQIARSGKGEAPGLLKTGFAVIEKAESLFSGTLAQHAGQDHGQEELIDREPPESRDLEEVVLDDAFWAEYLAFLSEFRDSVYEVMALRDMSKKAKKRHTAETKALLRRSQDFAHAMPPVSAAILAEIQLALS